MMGDALKHRLVQRPFEPFAMHITNGERVEVRHPEMAILTRSSVVVGHGGREGVADYVLEYSLVHVVKIEPLIEAAQQKKNGNGMSH